MRTDFSWFEKRARTTWSSLPGRSFLLIVPHGCCEIGAAEAVAAWAETNLRLPVSLANHQPATLRVTSDACRSAIQFIKKLRRGLEVKACTSLKVDDVEEPSELLEAIVDAADAQALYPVLIIERFHAFANISNDDFLSVLSALRSLEHSGRITTLALSPLSYKQIRRQLATKGLFPFVNSAYGDNHDLAIMKPLSRSEFVDEATSCGLQNDLANSLFNISGGPDLVFRAVIDAANDGGSDLIERCVLRLDGRLDGFIDSLEEEGNSGNGLLERLALGELSPFERETIVRHHLSHFFVKENSKTHNVTVSTPILARLILRRRAKGPYGLYSQLLAALRAGDLLTVGKLSASLDPQTARLRAFQDLVSLLATVYSGSGQGLLKIDWRLVVKLSTKLEDSTEIPAAWKLWAAKLANWATIATSRSDDGDDARERLDDLTRLAADKEVYELLLYAMSSYVKKACGHITSPIGIVRELCMIPESVLQAMAARFCDINHAKPPAKLVDGPSYDEFFGARSKFSYAPERKMDLTSLLVVVSAIISFRIDSATESSVKEFFRPSKICPLHQKLTSRLRNPVVHTDIVLSERESEFFVSVCVELLRMMAILADYKDLEDFSEQLGEPSASAIAAFALDEPELGEFEKR